MKPSTIAWALSGAILAPVACVGLGLGSLIGGYAADAGATVFNETKASTLLEKYRQFKRMHASLAKKKADIDVLVVPSYTAEELAALPRDMRQQYAQDKAARQGLILNFNQLASEYNTKMADLSWRFCNVGDLPQGATEPLPREYVTYETGNR